MILKERTYPLLATKYEALLRRLPDKHPKKKIIENELGKIIAGYRGEKSLDYYLSFLPSDECFILHDLRLPSQQNNYYFQMDLLILTQTYFLIIEVKNIVGTITYDPEFQQLIRHHENKESVFKDPILQVHRQRQQLQYWLSKQSLIHPIPILTTVILSNPQSIIKKTPNLTTSTFPLIRPDKLTSKIEELSKLYTQALITIRDIKKLAKNLKNMHRENDENVLNKFQLTYEDLIKGVNCPKCSFIPMEQQRYTWFCPKCYLNDKMAFQYALLDYFSLINSSITNIQLRDFLQVSSRNTAKRLLKSANLIQLGTNKGTYYSPK